ncbi:MAG: hypothetical protein F4X34_01180 [Chloroflexi bacterium]|nr:hypothetical protein [Chloroflexota bacterium]
MAEYDFERECRTPFSECYTVLDGDRNVGRLDVHFADVIVHATLNVDESLTENDMHDLIDMVDNELLEAAGIVRQEVIIHVHQGRDLGVYSTREYDSNGGFQFLS